MVNFHSISPVLKTFNHRMSTLHLVYHMFSVHHEKSLDPVLRLGGAHYGDAIDEMRDQEMDPLEEEHFMELLKQWKKVEDDIKDRLNELESEFNESG